MLASATVESGQGGFLVSTYSPTSGRELVGFSGRVKGIVAVAPTREGFITKYLIPTVIYTVSFVYGELAHLLIG